MALPLGLQVVVACPAQHVLALIPKFKTERFATVVGANSPEVCITLYIKKISQSTHAQRERAETFIAKINVIVYHDAVLDRGF